MELFHTERFDRSLRGASPIVQRAFWKQAAFLLANPNHPSLQAKKYGGTADIWQARVNRNWRFYFKIVGDRYYLLDIMAHPK